MEKTDIKGRWRGKRLLFLILCSAGVTLLMLLSSLMQEKAADDHAPSYTVRMYLSKNEYSRPGTALTKVKNIVIHYVANPGTSAKANRNYFQNLSDSRANPSGVKASSHFIVGLEGEVIQCVPMTEIAYANYPRNEDTVSVEVCHPDESGQFAPATYEAVTRLAADLCRLYGLTAQDVIRHYDVSGKLCPKYYVEHEDAWETLKADVAAKMAAAAD